MGQQDYYETLGIEETATDKEIKDVYRKLALQYHPDRNPDKPKAAEKMKSINEAYAVLSDSRKREEYDFMRQQFGSSAHSRFRQTYSEQDIFSGSDINRIFEDLARSFGLRGVDDVFREFYGQGYRTFEFRRPGFAARGYVFTGSTQAGKQEQIPMPGSDLLGKISRFLLEKITCIDLPQKGADVSDTFYLTPEEARQGGSFPYHQRKKDKKLMVTIPSGIKDGQKIRLSGMGEDGKGGAKPGDLYLRVTMKKPLLTKVVDFISDLRR